MIRNGIEGEDTIEKTTIGIDVGGHYIKYGLVSNNKVIEFHRLKTKREDILSSLTYIIKKYQKELISGISIGFPGFVRNGVVTSPPNLPIKRINFKDEIGKIVRFPLVVENDANLYALGEAVYGAGRNHRVVVLFTLGTGVGGGIVIDGKLFTGSMGFASEFGHIIINTEGPICGCGMRGCLESYIGADRIIERFKGLLKKGISTSKKTVESVKDIVKAAKNGDRLSIYVLNETGVMLGVGISTVINILDPDIVIVGGGIAKARNLILKPAREEVARRVIRRVPIVVSKLGDNAGLLGGYILLKNMAGHSLFPYTP